MSSVRGVFFALTGALIATSLVNIGDSGIPAFWIVFLLPLFDVASGANLLTGSRSLPRYFLPILLTGAVGTALIITTGFEIGMNLVPAAGQVLHLVSRLSFLLYFVLALSFLDEDTTVQVMLWLRRILIFVCLYGLYQLPARLLGYPLLFDWLRNNHSFSMYGFGTAGWIGLVRATSIYAEPSQAAVPITLLFLLNLESRSGRFSRAIGWISLLAFAAVTFSRTVWLALAVAAVSYASFRWRPLSAWARGHRLAAMMLTTAVLLSLPGWAFVKAGGYADLSRQERSGSIVLGLDMVKGSPWLGYGWNSFKSVEQDYLSSPVPGASVRFEMIHETVLSYMQQAGLSGLALAVLPFGLIVFGSVSPPRITSSTVAAFLVIAEFGGDIGYMSLVWLWIAVLMTFPASRGEHEPDPAIAARRLPCRTAGSRSQPVAN